jgi:hypothetical protein
MWPNRCTLAAMLRKDPETIIEAMKRLIACGFVTKHRRSKMIGTPQGERRVQDSNCYEVHMPDAGLVVVPLVADKVAASGSDNPGVGGRKARGEAFFARASAGPIPLLHGLIHTHDGTGQAASAVARRVVILIPAGVAVPGTRPRAAPVIGPVPRTKRHHSM